MTKILLMLKTHQPIRISEYSFFDLGKHKDYFNQKLNKLVINRIADNCYLPVNRLLQKLVHLSDGNFKFSVSISGTTLEQLERFRPDVLESFAELISTGKVEVLCEPYFYSLAFHYSKGEFKDQVVKHREKIESLFDKQPVSFLNTEFCYNNDLADFIYQMGFWGVLTEGVDWVLKGLSSDKIYKAPGSDINLFLRNHRLSDDVKFRYSDLTWKNYPLTAKKYSNWIKNSDGELISLFYDYENFGEHHKKNTGIFDFFEKVLTGLLKNPQLKFSQFQDEIEKRSDFEILDVPSTISRADNEKDLSAWKENSMQYEALTQVNELEEKVKETEDPAIVHEWRLLQTADHFYYMSTKGTFDGKVRKYFSPFNSPHDSYRYYMNILSDFELKVNKILNLKGSVVKKIS